jgi:hypothetical protein
MTQCAGKTQKGDRCKREARDGSAFCSIHAEQQPRPQSAAEDGARDSDWLLKAALGMAAIAAIVLFRIRR